MTIKFDEFVRLRESQTPPPLPQTPPPQTPQQLMQHRVGFKNAVQTVAAQLRSAEAQRAFYTVVSMLDSTDEVLKQVQGNSLQLGQLSQQLRNAHQQAIKAVEDVQYKMMSQEGIDR